MKYLITTLNSKYTHTSLSVRCLHTSVKRHFDCEMAEYTINDSLSSILADIYRKNADVICFSCYIWNFLQTMLLCENLKKANENLFIAVGGPEVTYTAEDTMKKYPYIDAVIIGEGEKTIYDLFDALKNGSGLKNVDGIAYRDASVGICVTNPRPPAESLDEFDFVYDETIESLSNRIIYYETSRGCPYRCTYCLSGERGGVRYLSMERVKREIDFFVGHNVPLVKLVDRTFNANVRRSKEIFKYIIQNAGNTRFHMELAGDLIDDETIDILSKADEKTFQFEIGVQTTNPRTMEAINRNVKCEPLKKNISRLLSRTKIHIHLDLIAGLPYEDYGSFAKSFNDVLALRPHVLQLGFLKLLKGSDILCGSDKFNYKYTSYAPYEVISNDFISYGELLKLHNIECILDKYYNSGCFEKTLDFMFDKYDNDYFKLFHDLSKYYENKNLYKKSLSKYDLYDIMYKYMCSLGFDVCDCLKYDYIKNIRSHHSPVWFESDTSRNFIDKCYAVLKNEGFKKAFLPDYFNIPAKTVFKSVKFEKFSYGVLLFDLKSDSVIDVSEFFTEEE